MNLNHRLDRVENALQPQSTPFVFRFCTETEHDDLSWEEHVELHRQHGELLFTLERERNRLKELA